MTNCNIEKIIARAKDEVYTATIDHLVWNIEYHLKRATECAIKGDIVLFEFNYQKYKEYKKILALYNTLES